MCGFGGFLVQSNQYSTKELKNRIQHMLDKLEHRGPNDSGSWQDVDAGVAFGHRRLSIVDLSSAGHQPMFSESGRYVIVYNGEIYNFRALQMELEQAGIAPIWKGHSDTEVILAAIEAWGLEQAVSCFIGMFAFALWDRQKRMLHLVRDRLGIKPLYYGRSNGTFLFGSELKALKANPDFKAEIDRDALALFFRYNCIPAPYTIYKGFQKLEPGTILTLQNTDQEVQISQYWDAWEVAEQGNRNSFQGSYDEAAEELDRLLRNAVNLRMSADVPLGAFLSGGIDSSTVVALMQEQSSRPVNTFSIGFHEKGYNEAPYAKAIASHLGTNHNELYVTSKQALGVVPKLPQFYDEPFSDSSQIPTLLVSELTRKYVTVSLSGDGGDEIFSGYNRYLWSDRIWKIMKRFPNFALQLGAKGLRILSEKQWNGLYGMVNPFVPKRYLMQTPGRNAHHLAEMLGMQSSHELYTSHVSHWHCPEKLVFGAKEPLNRLTQLKQPNVSSFTEWMMAQDIVTYLPDDILTKLDRASMSVSLEARVPLLDHRVVEFAWRLPLDWKSKDGIGKRILRKVLYRYVPKNLIERPKMGFGVPIDSWLRGPLLDWAEALLDGNRIEQEGYLNSGPIRKKWREHLSGRTNWQNLLWDVLMFQAWLEEQSN